jgi:hypothetical protein
MVGAENNRRYFCMLLYVCFAELTGEIVKRQKHSLKTPCYFEKFITILTTEMHRVTIHLYCHKNSHYTAVEGRLVTKMHPT